MESYDTMICSKWEKIQTLLLVHEHKLTYCILSFHHNILSFLQLLDLHNAMEYLFSKAQEYEKPPNFNHLILIHLLD